jgi:hypothetical protein
MWLLSPLVVVAGLDVKQALVLRHQAAVEVAVDLTRFATSQPLCLAQLKR